MSDSMCVADNVCIADYFADITYVDQLTHTFLALYFIVVLVRLVRAPEVKLSICDAHLIDAVCQISTISLTFATFRILRKENFNIQIPITSVLLTVLAIITTFTFGISVGRSWGMAEAMLQSNESGLTPSTSNNSTGNSTKSKRTIRPKVPLPQVNEDSDDSSLMSQQSAASKKKAAAREQKNAAIVAKKNKSAFMQSKEEDDKKKHEENAVIESIYTTVESAKVNLLSNLELNLLPSGEPSSGGNDSGEWKLVRTGYSSHIWLSKQRKSSASNDRVNSIMIKASCFSVMSVTDVALYLHENDITTGLECIVKHSTSLQVLKNNRVRVNRVSIGSTLAVAKRDFVAATYWLEIPETRSVVICTQSMPQSYSPKVKGVTRGTIHNCGFVIIPVAKARGNRGTPSMKKSSVSNGRDDDANTDIRCLISGQVPGEDAGARHGADSGCQILYFADIELGGTSGMATRRSTAAKGDAIINSLHALMDQLHRKVPGFHDASFNYNNLSWNQVENEGSPSIPAHVPTVLDCVFHDEQHSGPGGLSQEQTIELRALSVKTSDRLKNLYCNAVGLPEADEMELQRPMSPPMMRKTSVSMRDDEFINDVDIVDGPSNDLSPRRPSSMRAASRSDSGFHNHWTTFHEQDGISVSEFSHSDYPMDTLMASCHVEAAPHEVRRLLTESPEHVDGLLEQRDVLCRLDNRTSVQWIAYGAMWPIGARDFLVLTSESTFNSEKPFDEGVNTFHDSFILVSTSVDSIYEDIIESQSGKEGADDEPVYTRSYLRLAGYIGTRNKVKGGTDLRLFINLDIATYIPAWVMQIMSQYGLSEMMNRIRTALSAEKISEFRHMTQLGNSNASRLHARGAPSKLNTIMAQIQDREEKLRHMAKINPPQKEKDAVVVKLDTPDGSTLEAPETSVELDPYSDVAKGKKLAAESIRLLKIYAGIISDSKKEFDWQVKSKKGAIEVSTSSVLNSNWIALRATTIIEHADVKTLRNFLFDDSNLSSIDDMLDTVEPVVKVDENTAIRHMTFKGIWPTAPRDFVLCTTMVCDEVFEGRTRSFVTSISAWDDLLPAQRGYVRGTLLISGYVMEAVEGNPNSSRITMCAHSDLGGQLPSSIINALSVNAPIKILTAISEVLRSKQ